MIPCGCLYGYWLEPGRARLLVSKAGPRDGQIEDFDDLRPQRSREYARAAGRILSGNTSLLVRRRSERQVLEPLREPMPRFDTVSRGVHVRRVGAHRLVDNDRPVSPDGDSLRLCKIRRRPNACCNQNDLRTDCGPRCARHREAVANFANYFDRAAIGDLNVVSREFVLNQSAKWAINGRQHGRTASEDLDLEPATHERIRHLYADVSTADDRRAPGARGRETVLESERVRHGMQEEDTVRFQARDRGTCRRGSGGNHEAIVRDGFDSARRLDRDRLPLRIDACRAMSEEKRRAGCLEVGQRSMRQRSPVGDLTAMEERQPADAEVRKLVGHEYL